MYIFDFLRQDPFWYTWVILPLLICLARILDQSIGTLRIIFLSRGMKLMTPILAFFESIIWLVAVSQILKHVDNFMTFIAYGLGFALGNYVGILLDEKMSMGNSVVRIFPNIDTSDFIKYMKDNNFGYTLINAEGSKGALKIIFSIVKRKHLHQFLESLDALMPNSFYTIEEVKSVEKGIFKSNTKQNIFQKHRGKVKIK
ncbi:MAG: DUF5698 domain-containing protein [Bacteroidales bacterium]|nr:DUF5698 domain-containing protein [Bacteroidales bacterium]